MIFWFICSLDSIKHLMQNHPTIIELEASFACSLRTAEIIFWTWKKSLLLVILLIWMSVVLLYTADDAMTSKYVILRIDKIYIIFRDLDLRRGSIIMIGGQSWKLLRSGLLTLYFIEFRKLHTSTISFSV